MDITMILSLLGGLALFLYGMHMMSSGLESVAGNRMKQILEKLTSNRILGVIVGAVITAIIQSSSATTVMVVGFVNTGLMTLRQAVWVIMGANIGTTITGQLIALDVGLIAPLFAILGVAAVVFTKKAFLHHYGHIVAGLGILFIGMGMMSDSMAPLRESEVFINLVTQFKNPLIGILAGAVFTAIIQSSSASVGILQALAKSGLIGLDSAVFVLFGQNIGTCITAVLASIGTSRNARRATIIHLSFNIIGTALFSALCILAPQFTEWVASWTPVDAPAQIANMHTIFNVVTTLLLLPFGTLLAKLATKMLPDSKEEESDVQKLMFIKSPDSLSEYQVGNLAISIHSIKKELHRMLLMTKDNIEKSFTAVIEATPKYNAEVSEREEYIDFLNKEITKYISGILPHECSEKDSAYISALFKISGNIERIGDHAMNICEYTNMMKEKQIVFSERATMEIENMKAVSLAAAASLKELDPLSDEELLVSSDFEQKIDDMTKLYRQNQIDRIQEKSCSDEACIIYSEMLTDFERIGDHILNIAEALNTVK